jgi:hypothetical protein
MTWMEGVAIGLVVVGLLAGGYIAAQRPSFWLEFGARLIKAIMPRVIAHITKRMPADEEAEWRAAERAGRGDEWMRERWRKKLRGKSKR